MPADAASHPRTWTTRELIQWMASAFAERGLDSPRLSAELLLAHVLGCKRLDLYTDADRPASDRERTALRALVSRALTHEPMQYLIGSWPFFGISIMTDRRALIPRPCTEVICETVLQRLREQGRTDQPVRIADLCTGSGCIALALATNLEHASIVASDLSGDALELAQENATSLGLGGRIEWRQGDLWQAFGADETFDVVVSNPPYIPDHEWDAVEPNVKDHEPELALRGGADGLSTIRPLIEGASDHLTPNGLLAVEIAASTKDAVLALAGSINALGSPAVLDDHEGFPRMFLATRA